MGHSGRWSLVDVDVQARASAIIDNLFVHLMISHGCFLMWQALMNLPYPDFSLCVCLIPQQLHNVCGYY